MTDIFLYFNQFYTLYVLGIAFGFWAFGMTVVRGLKWLTSI